MSEAIIHFPTPTSITSVRSWFGLVNQVSYAFSQGEVMASFRELLTRKNRKFYWDKTLERQFQESKRVTVRKIEKSMQTFWVTGLATDYSKTGISYFLFQKHWMQRQVEHRLWEWLLEDYSDRFLFHQWLWIMVRTSGRRSLSPCVQARVMLYLSYVPPTYEYGTRPCLRWVLSQGRSPMLNVYTWVLGLASDSRSFTNRENIFGPGPGKYLKSLPIKFQRKNANVQIPDKTPSWKTQFSTWLHLLTSRGYPTQKPSPNYRHRIQICFQTTVKANKILIPRQLWAEVLESLCRTSRRKQYARKHKTTIVLAGFGCQHQANQIPVLHLQHNCAVSAEGTFDITSRSRIPISTCCCGL